MMQRFAILVAAITVGCAAQATPPVATPAVHANTEPMRWASWDAATFARAADENRIILVNVVASWCHWCHVMDEETYANPRVAALLADHFVTIRVDSDARPDLAERYREWAWPATAVLTSRGAPVLELRGYQDPQRFEALLRELVEDRDAGALTRRQPERRPDATDAPTELNALRRSAIAQLDGFYEPDRGGWGRRQKYPLDAPLEHALGRERTRGESVWSRRALQTLAGQHQLLDPIWGGMYQYSLQGDWNHPHYEKIAAIQAGALTSFALGGRATGDKRWLDAAQSVRRYLNDFMRDADGGYATSQDADLRTSNGESVPGSTYYALDDAGRRALGIPRIDTNVYADLNGLLIRGLVELSITTGDRAPLDDAESAAHRLLETHLDANGLFRHGESGDDGGLRFLRDQAAVLWAFMALHRATDDDAWLRRSESLADAMLKTFSDPASGGLFAQTPDKVAVGILAERRKPLEDNALAARALLRLHRTKHSENSNYLDAARRMLTAVGPSQQREGRMIGTYVLALDELLLPTVDVTVVGPAEDPTTDALHHAALNFADPRAHIERSLPGERYPDIGQPAVYLCTQTSCSPPLRDPDTLSRDAQDVLSDVLPPQKGPAPQ